MNMGRYFVLLLLTLTILGCGKADKGDRRISEDGINISASPAEPGEIETEDESYGAMPQEETAPESGPEMPAPHSPGTRSPVRKFNATPPKKRRSLNYDIVRVYYGTNRDQTGETEPSEFYGNNRDSLSIGYCDVSIPFNHVEGNIERPKIWKFEFRENPKKHVVLLSVQPTDTATFLAGVHDTLDKTQSREAFIFVHGYNVDFESAAHRTAQIAHDLKFDGVPMMFSWPAKGNLEDYTVDEVTSNWSKPDAFRFILAMAKFAKAERIHVIAHSMGNRVLTGALDRLSDKVSEGKSPKINQVILTAPDIDAQTFHDDIAPRIVPASERITVYASANDKALKASKFIHGNTRLGLTGRHLSLIASKGIDVVDASEVDTSLFGHSYYGDNVTVLDDIQLVLRGNHCKSRGLVIKKEWNAWAIIARKNPFKSVMKNNGRQ